MLGAKMKPGFYPAMPYFSPNNLDFTWRNGQHWTLRRGAPGRTGIFHAPLSHTWSEGHGRFKTNVQTPSTAMPRDRRITQPLLRIQVGSDYFICLEFKWGVITLK
jgi:hypothetical protein